MKVTQLEADRNFLIDMGKLQKNFVDIDRQLSSRKKLNILSDSPRGSASLVDISEQALRLESYRYNITASKYQLNSAEAALNAMNNAYTSINTLGSYAANESNDADGRRSILIEIEILRDEMIARANTRVDGLYIFAGTKVNDKPFVLGEYDANGVFTAAANGTKVGYEGNDTVNTIPIGDNVQVVAGVSGGEAGDNLLAVFKKVDDLIAAIKASIDEPPTGRVEDIAKSLDDFGKALDTLGLARGKVGTSLSVLQRMEAMLDTREGVLIEQRSRTEDADLQEVAVRIAELQTAINAASSAGSILLKQNTLFDFLG